MLRFITSNILLILSFCLQGQVRETSDSMARLKDMFGAGLGLQRGFIFAHSEAVQNTRGSNPVGLEFIFSWQRNDAQSWALCNCYPRKGLLLSVYDFDNDALRKGYSAAYFLEPVYKLRKNLFFSFRGAAGISYLTRPFDSITNPFNLSYSTHLNIYMLVGAGLWIRLNDHFHLNASVNYQHESNGGLRLPNKGINWPTAGLSLNYLVKPRTYYVVPRIKTQKGMYNDMRWDLAFFGIAKRALNEEGKSNRLPVYGIMLQGSRQVGRISMLTVSTELYKDHALRAQLKRDSVRASPVKWGLLAGHEFLLGRFLFNQRVGVYLFDQTTYFERIYHRWGVHFRATKHFGLGFNLQAHRQVADFIDFRLIYSLPAKPQGLVSERTR